ncbi:MAG: alpha-amylase family glycosyl hydrolase [Verrucomicrobiota bacterium]|mgnify:CR=1 FL=1
MKQPGKESNPGPHTRTAALLRSLYGERVGEQAALDVSESIARHSAALKALPGGGAPCERDTLLITYADQVREDGIAPLRTLASFCETHLAGVVSGIHILPFYPWSSDDGFSVKDYFAVEPGYGTWEDLAALREQFDLMFDAVFNHMSAQGDWFQHFLRDEREFRDFFVTVEGHPDLSQVVRPRALPLVTEFQTVAGPKRVWTTFSADQVDLNVRNPRVLLALLEALLFYVAHGARFIRLDAIAYLWKEIGTPCIHLPQTHAVIQLMRAVLDEVAPHIQLITETNVPHADNISYFGDGSNEAQLVYNFALPPLVLHSLQSGNAEKLTRWAQSLTLPSDRVTFFNFLASHDGIGLNPARGILSEAEIDALVARTLEHGGFFSCKHMPDGSRLPYEMNINYLDALSNPAAGESVELAGRKFLTAQAILLSLRGVPGIYFHSLFGSRGNRAAAEASGIVRRINREKLDRARLEAELADERSLRAHVFKGYRELLRARREHPALSPTASQRVLGLDARVFAVLRESTDGSERVLCLHNVKGQPVRVESREAGFAACPLEPFETKWLTGSR